MKPPPKMEKQETADAGIQAKSGDGQMFRCHKSRIRQLSQSCAAIES